MLAQTTSELPPVASPRALADWRRRLEALLVADERRLHAETRRFTDGLAAHPLLGGAAHEALRDSFRRMLNVSGRRVRPLLPFWLWRAAGADPARLDTVARVSLATLLIHSAAIVIDDVEDGSPERGGLATLHARKGEAHALNAASALVFAALEDLADPVLVAQAVDAVARCHAGQSLDLEVHDPAAAGPLFDAAPAARFERHAACATLKTAALMELCVTGAAHALGLGAQSAALAQAIRRYGVGYQILDDVKNFRPDLLGHKAYEDLRHPLKNWVCLELLAGWSPARLAEVRSGYGSDALAPLFLEDPALPAALEAGLAEGTRLVRGALAELGRLCAETDAAGYLSLLLARPLDDLLDADHG